MYKMTSLAVLAMASLPGPVFAEAPLPAKEPPKLVWSDRCAFAMSDGSSAGVKVPEHQCDFMLATQVRVQEFFNKSMHLEMQRDYLATKGKEADQALKDYEAKKAALLAGHDPSKVPEPTKDTHIIEIKSRIADLEKLRDALLPKGREASIRFGAGDKYLEPFKAQINKLKARIDKDRLVLPEQARREKEKTKKAAEKAFSKSKNKTGSAHALDEAAAKLKKGKGASDGADVDRLFSGKRRTGGVDAKSRAAHAVGSGARARLAGDNTASARQLGGAAQYTKYGRDGGGQPILDGGPKGFAPAKDSLAPMAPPSPAAQPKGPSLSERLQSAGREQLQKAERLALSTPNTEVRSADSDYVRRRKEAEQSLDHDAVQALTRRDEYRARAVQERNAAAANTGIALAKGEYGTALKEAVTGPIKMGWNNVLAGANEARAGVDTLASSVSSLTRGDQSSVGKAAAVSGLVVGGGAAATVATAGGGAFAMASAGAAAGGAAGNFVDKSGAVARASTVEELNSASKDLGKASVGLLASAGGLAVSKAAAARDAAWNAAQTPYQNSLASAKGLMERVERGKAAGGQMIRGALSDAPKDAGNWLLNQSGNVAFAPGSS